MGRSMWPVGSRPSSRSCRQSSGWTRLLHEAAAGPGGDRDRGPRRALSRDRGRALPRLSTASWARRDGGQLPARRGASWGAQTRGGRPLRGSGLTIMFSRACLASQQFRNTGMNRFLRGAQNICGGDGSGAGPGGPPARPGLTHRHDEGQRVDHLQDKGDAEDLLPDVPLGAGVAEERRKPARRSGNGVGGKPARAGVGGQRGGPGEGVLTL